MYFNSSIGLYSCQLDDQWFNLNKDILRDALDITPTNDNNPFVAPPSSDTVIEYITLWDTQVKLLDSTDQDILCCRFCGKNLATTSRGKKKTTHLLIPRIRFTKLVIHHLKTKHNTHPRSGSPLYYSRDESVLNTLRYVGKDGREIFSMPIPDAQLTDEIKGAPYYGEYQEYVAKYQQHLDAEHGKAIEEGATESSKATKVTKPKAAKAKKPATDLKPKPAPTQLPKAVPKKKRKLVQETPDEPSLAKRSKVDEEPDSGRFQLLPEVQGKGKEKRRTPMLAEASGPAESPSLDAELALTDSETESDDEGEAGPNPSIQDEGEAGSNHGDAAGSQPQSSHVVHAGPNLEPMDLEATDASPLQNHEQLDEEFTTTAYPNVQENLKLPSEDLFFVEKQHEEEPGKTNVEAEVQSMVSVPIHQETSSVPPMTTSVIDLMTSQSGSPLPTSSAATLTVMTTTTIPPPPSQSQQSTTDPTLMKRIDELEQHMVSKAVDEIVTDAFDWAMQAHLRACFSDLPTVDMKKILQQRMFESKSYEAHEDHKKLYDALEKSLERDYSDKLLSDLEEAHSPSHSTAIPALDVGSPHSQMGISEKPLCRIHLSDDEESANDHLPKAYSRKDWWKPLPEEERLATPEPALTIPPSNVYVENNWATVFASTYTKLTQADLEGQAYEVVKAFYPDVINLQFQMEECHKLLTNQVMLLFNRNSSLIKLGVLKTWQQGKQFCTIDFQDEAYSRYGYDYLSEIILRRANLQEHTIAEKDFKNLHPSDFKDLNLLLLQGHLDHLSGSDKRMLFTAVKLWTRNLVIRQRVEDFQLGIESHQTQLNLTKPGWDASGYEFKHDYTIIESPRAVVFPVNNNERKIMRFNEIYKFSDGMLTQILEALAYRVKEFKIKRLNPGMNTRFWTQKDVTRSKEFIEAIERRLKMRMTYQNLECFAGGRVRDIDYRLLQRTD
nr:hypothetical protein [Tanacetum cinerariifolium]